jgi:hypothetical protein
MRGFSSSPHHPFMAPPQREVVQSVQLRPAHLAIAVGIILASGIVLGGYAASFRGPRAAETSEPPAAVPTLGSPRATLSSVDAPGIEIDGLPRYPGAVRTAHEILLEGDFRLTANEYQARATVDEVRVFYQAVIAEHGWERADISFDHGEWSYILVDGGGVEALVEIEEFGGLVEIDLQVSEPIASPAPASTAPDPTPAPTTAPVAPPPPPPPPGDDDDDEDGGADSDDG